MLSLSLFLVFLVIVFYLVPTSHRFLALLIGLLGLVVYAFFETKMELARVKFSEEQNQFLEHKNKLLEQQTEKLRHEDEQQQQFVKDQRERQEQQKAALNRFLATPTPESKEQLALEQSQSDAAKRTGR